MDASRIRSLLRRPIVVAPMAGGPSTPALVAAAADAGAIGFLAAGYKSAAAMKAEIDAVRSATAQPFGVNLFVPGTPAERFERVATYLASLTDEARELGAGLGEPVWDDDEWGPKLDTVLHSPPPLVSFTFGCPAPGTVEALRAAGTVVAITVTSAQEARLATDTGADCLCVQGPEAGAHRGTFANHGDIDPGPDVRALIDEVASVTHLPQIAAGGIMTSSDVAAVLQAGAVAAQCGTAFLRTPESGAHPLHKAALADPQFTSTGITRSFSGRPARGLVNRFMREHADAPAAYPEINNATRPLRSRAGAVGDVERMSLWAGVGFRQAGERPTAQVVELLSPR